jgi:two-component system chemotaxis response regulator CheB
VIIIGSAGGIPALIELFGLLPCGLPFPIIVAQHLGRTASNLDIILSARSGLDIRWASEGKQPERGQIYLVPPGMGLQIDLRGFSLTPLGTGAATWLGAVDLTLKSVAAHCGRRTVAIVLSGSMAAGIEGFRQVNFVGGVTMAQSQSTSEMFEMPSAAIDFGKAEIVASPKRMAAIIEVIAHQWHLPH